MSTIAYRFGRVPEELLYSDASDRACRLHALLTRWADTRPDEQPTREKLAKQLRCSVDSADRAIKELQKRGALQVERDRYDPGTKAQLPNRYVLEGAASVPRRGRTGAALVSPAGIDETAGDGGRIGAQGGSRTRAAPYKERDRSKKEQKNTPPPASAAEPETQKATAQTLLKEHLDALDHDLVTKGRLASTIKGLLTHGATATETRAALTLMRQRNLTHPSVLAGLVDEHRGQRNGSGSRNGDRRPPPEIPEADLSTRPPRHDPAAMMAWSDREVEEATRT